MIFVDASALVAIIAREDGSPSLLARLKTEETLLCSAVARWEAIVGLRRSFDLDHAACVQAVDLFLQTMAFTMLPIGEREGRIAEDASREYGKGRHPAALNMGDCFAYACAKAAGAQLLYKGNDFSLTDLA